MPEAWAQIRSRRQDEYKQGRERRGTLRRRLSRYFSLAIVTAPVGQCAQAEAVKGWLRSSSGFCLDGWVVDPGFGGWGGGSGWLLAEPVGVGVVGGIEDGLSGGDDWGGGAGVEVGWV